jgi:hypothetical protein
VLPTDCYPYGYIVEVTPKPPPVVWTWTVGPVRPKLTHPTPGAPGTPAQNERIIVQLTADQQVELSISGEDAYGNPVDVSGDTVWSSSDESIVNVQSSDGTHATATAVGPIGTAAVTISNDVNHDGTGDFQGSLAIDVVAGNIAEITIAAGEPTTKA